MDYDPELEEKLLEETAKLENLLEKSEGENREINYKDRESNNDLELKER